MTEEIIIDCAFYKDGVCASPINKTCEYCKNINVSKCYHKQLKSLEQANKELIEDNLNLSKENKETIHYLACMTEQRNKLKIALEEIREILNKKCGIISNAKVVGLINEVLDEEMS